MDLTKTSTYDYYLPDELIAQKPLEKRDSSRLLIFDKSKNKITHKHFFDIIDYLHHGDVLVTNNTKVIPCRLLGIKTTTKIAVEVFLLKRIDLTHWEALVKPGRRLKEGTEIFFDNLLSAVVKGTTDFGGRIIEFKFNGVFEEILDKLGQIPLPPYIKEKIQDKNRYQTVYAKFDGSSAAPTAGFHFTNELLQKIKDKGIEIVEVLLHIGLGTFRPVKSDNILEHQMHTEYYEVSNSAADKINKAKAEGRRIIAVGTTSVRTLESSCKDNKLVAQKGFTNIFIYPPYKFKIVDGLITNFHLPKSTLIMLVSAFAGYENTMQIYNTAVKEKYRFFSFGDSMFIF